MADKQMTRQEREAAARRAADEARLAAFIAKGDASAQAAPIAPTPAQVAVAPSEAPPEQTAPIDEGSSAPQSGAQAAVAAATEPAEDVPDAETPTGAHEPAKEAKKGRAKPATPWADAHPKVTVNFSTKFSEEQHMKLTWLTENMTGRQSIQKLVHAAVDAHIDKLLKQHYKP